MQVDAPRQQHDGDQHGDAEHQAQDIAVDGEEDQQTERHPDVGGQREPLDQHRVDLVTAMHRLPAGDEHAGHRADDDGDLRIDGQRHQWHAEQGEAETGHDLGERGDEDCHPDEDQLGCRHNVRLWHGVSPTLGDVLPIIDITDRSAAAAIDAGCRSVGFFAISNHGVASELRGAVIAAATEFFARPAADKEQVSLARGGAAWRGWFPLGGELTSGVPDLKEGYYFGRELPPDRRPMHGPNVWPRHPDALRPAVTEWMTAMEQLGQRVLSLMAEGLGLPADFFATGLTADPTVLFRIFRYPPHPDSADDRWGVGQHSDYGLLTLLAHDGKPGLEVQIGEEWVPAPSDPELIICNLGDMLDRLTAGRYRSTPHRARNHAAADRYSLPFFLDPGWDAVIEPIQLDDGWEAAPDAGLRWDRADLRTVEGTYGQWLTGKVSKVFPDLARAQRLKV
jgi:isopenicillin N synthase-like dioxygenase